MGDGLTGSGGTGPIKTESNPSEAAVRGVATGAPFATLSF